MGRPKGAKMDYALGFVSENVTTLPKPVNYPVDPIPHGHEENSSGIVVESGAKKCPKMCDVFEPGSIAYLRKLAAHRIRIRKEMEQNHAKLQPVRKKGKNLKRGKRYSSKNKPVISFKTLRSLGGRNLQDLKIVNCGKCKKVLLGESELGWIEKMKEKGKKWLKSLPPVTYGIVDGRPICKECKDG